MNKVKYIIIVMLVALVAVVVLLFVANKDSIVSKYNSLAYIAGGYSSGSNSGSSGSGSGSNDQLYNLTITKAGNGFGSVSPYSGTTKKYRKGSVVTISSSPQGGSYRGTWSGCDSVAGGKVVFPTPSTCTVTMNSDRTVVARINKYTNIKKQTCVEINEEEYVQRIADSKNISPEEKSRIITSILKTKPLLSALTDRDGKKIDVMFWCWYWSF